MKELDQKPFFTNKEAQSKGISPRMLSYYVKKGKYERIVRGIYRSTKYEPDIENLQWEDLAIAASSISGGVICLVSALVYYELTDEMMKEFWVAVNNENSKVNFPMTRIVRMRDMETGVKEAKIASIKVRIFDIERTIIDSYRLIGQDIALKALKIYLSGEKGKPDLKRFNEYTYKLRASKMRENILALLS